MDKNTRASNLYSMTAFDAAVNMLIPEIKIMNTACPNTVGRPEQIKMVAYQFFLNDHVTSKELEAVNVVRSVAQEFKKNGHFVYGSKDFNPEG